MKMIEIVSGRAGTGKTHYCLERVAERIKKQNDSETVIIVPEHDTFNMECKLLEMTGGFMNAQVSGFKRYAYRVLTDSGIFADKELSDFGKKLLLSWVINDNKDNLTTLASSVGKIGFVETMLRMFADFINANIMPDMLTLAVKKLPQGNKKEKLQDVAMLFSAWHEKRKDFSHDSNDYQSILVPNLQDSRYAKEAHIVIDGFQWFSKQEWCVIEKWLQLAKSFTVSLSLDGKGDIEALTFSESKKTRDKIMRLAKEYNISITEHLCSDNRRFKSDGLLVLEGVACDDASLTDILRNAEKAFDNNDVVLFEAENNKQEIGFIVNEIKRLCREEGYYYKDIAVLVPDEFYGQSVTNNLQREQLPVFYDQTRSLAAHPLCELLQVLFALVEYSAWNYLHIFRLFKTGLCNISEEECDILENFVLRYGIAGKHRWTMSAKWQYGLKDDAELNEYVNVLRKKAIAEVNLFLADLRKANDIRGFAESLYKYMIRLSVVEKLEKLASDADSEDKAQEAEEHRHIWNNIIDVLDEMVVVAGTRSFSMQSSSDLEDIKTIFLSTLQEVKIKIIQPSFDYVTVLPFERAKGVEKKVIFLCGAEEGALPTIKLPNSFLSEQERLLLERVGIELPDGREFGTLNAVYSAYTAVTRATEKNIFTYTRYRDDGTQAKPALWIRTAKEVLFDEEHFSKEDDEKTVKFEINDIFEAVQNGKLAIDEHLKSYLRAKDKNDILYKLEMFIKQENAWKAVKSILPEFVDLAMKADKSIAISISKLQTYFSCPYSFFATYILALKEREIKGWKIVDVGDFLHKAIECFVHEQKDEKTVLTSAEAEEKAKSIVERIIQEDSAEIYDAVQQKAVMERLTRRLAKFLCHLTAFASVLPYEKTDTERNFLISYKALADNTDKIILNGKIDRVDNWGKNSKLYQLAIDYKTNKGELDLAEVFYGIKLQLPVYLLALKEEAEKNNMKWSPAGLLYYSINPGIISDESAMSDIELQNEQWKKMKLKGLLLDDKECWENISGLSALSEFVDGIKTDKEGNVDENKSKGVWRNEDFEKLISFAKNKMQEGVGKIAGGAVDVAPLKQSNTMTACKYCKYQALCCFEGDTKDSYKFMRKITKDELLNFARKNGSCDKYSHGEGGENNA